MASIVRTASVWFLAVLFASSLAAFFAALSAAQLTTAETGERILRRAVAVSTDLDAAMPGIQEKLLENANATREPTLQVPDFPIPVRLTREEAQTLTAPQLRDRILDESAAILYERGMSPWSEGDPDANRDLQRVSAAGALNEGLGQVHDTTHSALVVLAVLLGIITLGLALALFISVPWDARLLVLGGAGLLAGLPLLAAAVALRFAFRTAGPDTDAFVNALFDIGADGMWVPIRNYFTLTMVSLGVMAAGTLLLWWEARYVQIERRQVDSA
jgi:hypothetical protein